MLSVQEITFYNDLVEKNIAGKINCPFDANDVVVTKVNDENEVYFKCLGCDTVFYPGLKVEKIIKNTIDKHISNR
jgi:Trk K+ transport system NAD-binding subunit